MQTKPENTEAGHGGFPPGAAFLGYTLIMSEVVKDPEILGGVPVFAGTRVPVKNLFDALIGGDTIETFLEEFPTVKCEQVKAVLTEAEHAIEDLVAA